MLPASISRFCHPPTFASMASAIFLITASHASHAAPTTADLQAVVDASVTPVMKKYNIPGVTIGVINGKQTYYFDYGVASTQTRKPVDASTLFELGSISKTFTATLAAYAQEQRRLKLSDPVSRYLPDMQDTAFGEVSLLSLGTHTPGGFPLQVPDDIHDTKQLMSYLQQWQPQYTEGTKRTYANPSIGMLGLITAKAMGQDFIPLVEKQIYAGLGLHDTYIDVPAAKMKNYAQGYTKEDTPTRVSKAVLWAQAYGAKSTSRDMVRFLQANMGLETLDTSLQKAVTDTHTGYYQTAAMTQDLVWEQYPYPAPLKSLVRGNSAEFALTPQPVTALTPPVAPREEVWINKTGSTNGFGAYVAFVPGRKLGVVILANKNYPMEDRITIAHKILTTLDDR